MSLELIASDLIAKLAACSDADALSDVLGSCCGFLGFAHFAVVRHFDGFSGNGFRIHNYPLAWQQEYDRARLGLSDPIHRASHVRTSGFRWRDVPHLIGVTPRDRAMLARARDFDIADGFTLPAHIPGELRGSVTFVARNSQRFPDDRLVFAHALGSEAFEAAHRIFDCRPIRDTVGLTPRELECVVGVGKGESNREIAERLHIRPDTVKKHLQNACARYEIARRAELPLRAIYENALCFSDIFHQNIP